MILEGLVTTLNDDRSVHLAPMGPEFDGEFGVRFVLRPYQSSQTFENLHRTGQGVFHVTDDVELIAAAAIGRVVEMPRHRPADEIEGVILLDASRWYAFRVDAEDLLTARAVMRCRVVAEGTQREFIGFNRAKHAVLEAAILATRLAFLDRGTIESDLDRWRPLVDKTGGDAEKRAFAMLTEFIRSEWSREAP